MTGGEDRARVFVDGNNFYHGCAKLGLQPLGRLNFARISRKLAGPRVWVGTTYYVGEVKPVGNLTLSADQKAALQFIAGCDPRITVRLGRIESRPAKNHAAIELKRYLASLSTRLDVVVYRELQAIAAKHTVSSVMVEKGVDVQLPVDMVVSAERGEYETAYLLSADSDLVPAVRAVRETDRKVFVASAQSGVQLAQACDTFIPLRAPWFEGMFGL
ncbi:MAG: NYN domain-containing protein [Candidatus Eisenbacteria bacterium]